MRKCLRKWSARWTERVSETWFMYAEGHDHHEDTREMYGPGVIAWLDWRRMLLRRWLFLRHYHLAWRVYEMAKREGGEA